MDTTLVYHLVLFLHILGAFGLIAALTFEVIGLRGLRQATQREDALMWLGLSRMVQRLVPASLGVIVLTGLYMTAPAGAAGAGSSWPWPAWSPWR